MFELFAVVAPETLTHGGTAAGGRPGLTGWPLPGTGVCGVGVGASPVGVGVSAPLVGGGAFPVPSPPALVVIGVGGPMGLLGGVMVGFAAGVLAFGVGAGAVGVAAFGAVVCAGAAVVGGGAGGAVAGAAVAGAAVRVR